VSACGKAVTEDLGKGRLHIQIHVRIGARIPERFDAHPISQTIQIRGEPQSAVDRLRISSTVARGRGRSLQKRVSAASKAKTNNNLSRRL
jgi:hypothetical protein